MESANLNLYAGWLGMLGGVLSGAVIGLFFRNESWMGGYGSWRRRMARLGHIAFFGIGFINLLFALSVRALGIAGPEVQLASWCLIAGLITMPLCCFLSAWRQPFANLFPLPVLCVLVSIVALLKAWPAPT